MRNKKQYNQRTNTVYDREQRAKYGQNYIKDPSLVRRLLEMTTVTEDDTVLEIGPGHGVFTAEILKKAGELVSIEIDAENVDILKRKFKSELQAKQLEIVHKDALLFEPRWAQTTLVGKHYKVNAKGREGALGYKIVASIPYSISSQLFKKFLLKKPMPSEAWFTAQKEFAQRVLGDFAQEGKGLLSVLILSFYEGKVVHEFAREDFSPVPSVDSVFLELVQRKDVPELVTLNFGQYKDFVTKGFTQPIRSVQKHFNGVIPANKLQQLADKNKFKLKQQTTELIAQQWQALFVESLM